MLGLEDLAELLEKNRAAAQARVKEFSIGGRHFAFNSRPAIMGVINLSPDSWYRESVCLTAESAVRRGKVMSAQGADIIDVGRGIHLGPGGARGRGGPKQQAAAGRPGVARSRASWFRWRPTSPRSPAPAWRPGPTS